MNPPLKSLNVSSSDPLDCTGNCGGQEPRDGLSPSEVAADVAFVEIWSDERLLCRPQWGKWPERGEKRRGTQDGCSEGRKATSRNYSALTKESLSFS